jgi:hypothetical protein
VGGVNLLESLLIQIGPVSYTAREAAHVHEIKAVPGIRPFATAVVNLEADVVRCAGDLGWRKIGAWLEIFFSE